MFKLLGHFLALAAMTASVINAQCIVSCSLHSNSQSPSSEVSTVNSGRSDHSCCPHQGAPGPLQPKDGHPCDRTVATDDVRLKNSGISFNLIPVELVGWSHVYSPQFAKTLLEPPTGTHSPGLSQPSLLSILRV